MMRRVLLLMIAAFIGAVGMAQISGSSWMSGLPDNTPVSRVSIPGTHDSGTSGVRFPMRHYARTQSMSLADQWDAGIRFFDLRPKLENGILRIYHGPANCHLTFADALLVLKQKIEQSPTEFCIVMTNLAGGGQQATDKMMDEIRCTLSADMLAIFKPDITVADIRGRILFIHRNSPSRGVETPGTVVHGWPGNGTSYQARLVSRDSESAVLLAQDYFTLGSNDPDAYLSGKWDHIYRLLRAFRNADDGVWCINHASGYTGSGISTNIRRNVNNTNNRLLNSLRELDAPVGIIPMDFPSQELIDAIIILNTL